MYRSPGSASSPDLVTLLKKTKQRNGSSNVGSNGTGNRDASDGGNGGGKGSELSSRRLRTTSATPSSTSSNPIQQRSQSPRVDRIATTNSSSSSFQRGEDPSNFLSVRSPDWVLPSPSTSPAPSPSIVKIAKASVRAKTSAFLGKMWGQATVRDRSRTINGSLPTSVSSASAAFQDTFRPPVPPLPSKQPPTSVSDVFGDAGTSLLHSPNLLKPLPNILSGKESLRISQESDSNSIVVVTMPGRGESPTMTPIAKEFRDVASLSKHTKRRSMSVSDVDVKRALAQNSPMPPRLKELERTSNGWGSSLSGMFAGELSGLVVPPLSLQDPTTPIKRLSSSKGKAPAVPLDLQESKISDSPLNSSTSIPADTPIVNIEPASIIDDSPLSSPEPAMVPPRSSSLNTPVKTTSPTSPSSYTRGPGLRYGPRSASGWSGSMSSGAFNTHGYSGSRDSPRPRIHHRSTASNSEPSLIPRNDDPPAQDDSRHVRLVPSAGSSFSRLDTMSPITPADIGSTGDLMLLSGSDTTPGEEPDIDSKAKSLAARCWTEDEEFLAKEKIAEWLGGSGRINNTALGHYIENFDFSGLRLDMAFRRLCAKLYLKAETQQVDRILDTFASRYWVCNRTSVYGSPSVVHAVAYSLLLLNTDLHVAELSTHMSRNQFVRNTLSAIQMQLHPNSSNSDFDSSSGRQGSDYTGSTPGRGVKRSDSITSWNSLSKDVVSGLSQSLSPQVNESTASFQATNNDQKENGGATPLYDRNWENEMETMLKDMYTAIKNQQVLQPLGTLGRMSTSSLSPHGTLMRNRSTRGQPDRLTAFKRGSIRGLGSILAPPSGASPYSSNSSIDGRASPAPSFATSNELHASTTSFMTPTLGFASNLSHTIIREAQEDDDHSTKSRDTDSTDISISDEELALLGAPWAKEGMLCRKQFWEATGKKARVRSWMDVFVVIQRGEVNMFTFGDRGSGGGGVVGGGNWLENAQSVGTLHLAHSLAHALPPPGYNRQRPHCMVLTLANGGVYFLQAGTEELVNEWVSTCNYWAARQSKEPLAGGVSNMEYGWNRVLDPPEQVRSMSDNESSRTVDRSDVMSVRSTRSRYGRKDGAASMRSSQSPWMDRTFINDWKAPLPPTVASIHDEETQLEALQKHVKYMSEDLKRHNELRTPMMELYTPRSPNANKALLNWENKSKYLLSEIVKYQSYIDSLQHATALRLKKRGERALERALVVADPDSDDGKGARDDETIQEHGTSNTRFATLHRRESAQVAEG
ncbi:hypothetical protein BDM02DRAFT_2709294 [Thelephora ganbajun]|uniref:Uncharacterized protein n=1 Tax=Thelephora ganbajun TaxID=370292 RepID=A0ACB6ZC97_THEGA|nr:hypothetical protein BDM02DRAFT_2709294 [Thelephora ganbajun]